MDPSSIIISALKDRDISFRRDDIQSVLRNGPGSTKIAEWLMRHVTPDTMLSQEELTLYSKLESSGDLQSILTSTNMDVIQPLQDNDLWHAIQILDASTGAITKQVASLELQYGGINMQSQSNDGRKLCQNRDVARLCQKHKSWRQNIAAASSDLAHVLELDLRSESERATTEGKRLLSTLTTRLKEDDRLIVVLERLSAQIEFTGQDETIVEQASGRSRVLAQCISDEIQHRLDRLYLESLQRGLMETQSKPQQAEDEALVALKGELDSLYPEISILAEMSTRQEFTEPMVHELGSHHGKLRIDFHQKLDYVLDVISKMASYTGTLIRRLQDRESFCGMLETIAAAHQSEVGDLFTAQTTSTREALRHAFVQLTPTFISSKNRDAPVSDTLSLAKLLRREGLSLESILDSEKVDEGSKALQGKRLQLTDSLYSHGIAADSPMATGLFPTDQAIRLLSTCLHTNSQFESSLSRPEHRERLSSLELRLNEMKQGLKELDPTVLLRRDRGRDRFVDNWGSRVLED